MGGAVLAVPLTMFVRTVLLSAAVAAVEGLGAVASMRDGLAELTSKTRDGHHDRFAVILAGAPVVSFALAQSATKNREGDKM